MRPPAFPLVVLAAGLGLVACSSEPVAPERVDAVSSLNGIALDQPLKARGNEPFWGVDITADTLRYSGADRQELVAIHDGPLVQGTLATWRGTTPEGQTLVLTLIATECSDTMSDRIYPLIARLEVGDESLNGCAATASALANAGEAGLVVDPPAAPES